MVLMEEMEVNIISLLMEKNYCLFSFLNASELHLFSFSGQLFHATGSELVYIEGRSANELDAITFYFEEC